MPRILEALIAALTLILIGPAALSADEAGDRVARIEGAWLDWAGANGVTHGVIAVTHEGAVVAAQGLEADPEAAFELASLSKAVTAICLRDLVAGGATRYDATLGALLGWEEPVGAITLGGLVTHSAGLMPDSTQGSMPDWLDRNRPRWARVGERVRARGTLGVPNFAYNNENYALIGLAIEAATGKSYPEACARTVADYPSAALSARTGVFAPWGGWVMSPSDYARFFARAYGGRPPEGPVAEVEGEVVYGLGALQRPFRNSWNAWHFGSHCFPGRLEAGSYAALWEGRWGVVVVFDRCVAWEALFALDAAIAQAALGGDMPAEGR